VFGAIARAPPGGVFVGYVPTVLQLKDTVETLQRRPDFAEIESFETLMRNWHVKGMSVRPVHRMIAHSAFIIVARRLSDTSVEIPAAVASEVVAEEATAGSESAIDQPDDLGNDLIDDDDSDGDLSES